MVVLLKNGKYIILNKSNSNMNNYYEELVRLKFNYIFKEHNVIDKVKKDIILLSNHNSK